MAGANDTKPLKDRPAMSNTSKNNLFRFSGLIATIVGGLLLTWSLSFVLGDKEVRPFHDIKWEGRAAAHHALSDILHGNSIDSFIERKVQADTSHGRKLDSAKLDTLRKKYRDSYYKILTDLYDSSISLSDSDWEKANGNMVTLISTDGPIDNLKLTDKVIPSTIAFSTSKLPGYIHYSRYDIPVEQAILADHYLIMYPAFGLWALLIIIQLTLYPLLILWLLYKLYRDHTGLNKYKPEPYVVVLHLLCPVMCCVFYYYFLEADGNSMVKPQYFMMGLERIFYLVNYMGYTCAGLGFACMLLIYISIRKVRDEVGVEIESNKALALEIDANVSAQAKAEGDAVAMAAAEKMQEELKKRTMLAAEITQEQKDEYNKLAERFNLYFTLLAIILTLATLSTSSLFTGLDGLSYIKALGRSVPHKLFPTDMVYLYAIIHSAILLSFYILIRSQLQKLRSLLQIADDEDVNKPTFAGKILDLIITGSPLLASLLQTMFENFK